MSTDAAPPRGGAPHLTGGRPAGAAGAPVSQAEAAARELPAARFGESREGGAVGRPAKLWLPRRVLVTRAAAAEPHGQRMLARLESLGLRPELLTSDRLPPLTRGLSTREAYRAAKDTLALVNAPPSQLRSLQPIPPSADYQFHLAKGCPAHCQYCYLAGSLPGAPVTRVYANLDAILASVREHALRGVEAGRRRPADPRAHPGDLTFEASCYTDPLGIEHLTGSLSATVEAFAKTPGARLRWVTKYDAVDPLIALAHGGRTRCRVSLNPLPVTRRLEGGTADLTARLHAMRRLAIPRAEGGGGYPVGAVIAPIVRLPDWRAAYAELLDALAAALEFGPGGSGGIGGARELTFELITHRFTPGSKAVLLDWYPATRLDLDEASREVKRNRFGSEKYVFPRTEMRELRDWFEREIAARFGEGRVLYFT